jgi:SAM-dependent methyltransferase
MLLKTIRGMNQVLRVCPICEGADIGATFNNMMSDVGGFDMSYAVGRCTSCGFHFAHRLADEATFQNYYQAVSKYDVASKISQVDCERINFAVKFCEILVDRSEMIVDIGCGFGAMLSALREGGWSNIHGVDPAPNSANCAKTLFDLDSVHCGTMAQAHTVVPLGQADVVCFMAVLEHLPNLRADLLQVLEKLKLGCRVLVEVPAVEYFSAKNNEPFGEFSLEHIQFFTEISLSNLFKSLGWEVEKTESLALPLVGSGSIFGLFRRSKCPTPNGSLDVDNGQALRHYVTESWSVLKTALQCIPKGPLLIYGAGSHSARLLPHLEKMPDVQIVAVVDSNPNLLDKKIGQWTIQSPSVIEASPELPVLVSSFRSQHEIASSLQSRYPNPLVLMYG